MCYNPRMSMTKLKYGNTNTYLINSLLFDTDMFGTIAAFYKCLKHNNIQLHDIKYVLCSHYHPDHMGLVSELMKEGIKLLLLDNQKAYIHFSDKIFGKQFGQKYNPIDEKNAVIISAQDSRSFLKKLGINGQIITTSSHSKDGIALILDDGQCFVGDLEPVEFIDGYENNDALKTDWENIRKLEPEIIYYGHVNDQIVKLF